MLATTTIDVYTQISSVSSSMFADFKTPVILIVGTILAFFVAEIVTGSLYKGRGDYKGVYDEE